MDEVRLIGSSSQKYLDAMTFINGNYGEFTEKRMKSAFFDIMVVRNMHRPDVQYAIAEEENRWLIVVYDRANIGLIAPHVSYCSKRDYHGHSVGLRRVVELYKLGRGPYVWHAVRDTQKSLLEIWDMLQDMGPSTFVARGMQWLGSFGQRTTDNTRLGPGKSFWSTLTTADEIAIGNGHVVHWTVEDSDGETTALGSGKCTRCGSDNFTAYSSIYASGYDVSGPDGHRCTGGRNG